MTAAKALIKRILRPVLTPFLLRIRLIVREELTVVQTVLREEVGIRMVAREETAGADIQALRREETVDVNEVYDAPKPERMRVNAYTKRCFLCGSAVGRYNPLPDFYFEESAKHGRDIYKSAPETLNRMEYTCPVCGADDRSRLYAMYIKKYFTRINPGENFVFLDIAPSKILGDYINQNWGIDYRTMDVSTEGVTYNDDITNITSVGDGQVDFIICSHVLEHVGDDKKALSEIYRIMKPNAKAIIMVPLDLSVPETEEDINATEAECWRRFGQFDHVRKYAKGDFVRRLKETGFHVRGLGMKYFGMEEYYLNALVQTSTLYVAEKPDKEGNVVGKRNNGGIDETYTG